MADAHAFAGNNIKLVLLDRDGVLNIDRPDSVKTPDELVFISGSLNAVKRLNNAGFKVALCSNQAVVGRGIISQTQLDTIQDKLHDALAQAGARLDASFVCTDVPEAEGGRPTQRRKPAPGLLLEAMAHFQLKPAETVMIGDALTDLQAAKAAGIASILVRTGKGNETERNGIEEALSPCAVHANLEEAVEALLA